MACISRSGSAATSPSPTLGDLLEAALAASSELNPGASDQDAAEIVTSAADAMSPVLEHAGLIGSAIEAKLAEHVGHELKPGGSRTHVTTNDTLRLLAGWDC